MSSKLSTANPYLLDPIVRQRSVLTSVSTSSAIEGIHAPFRQAVVKLASANATRAPADGTARGRVKRPKP